MVAAIAVDEYKNKSLVTFYIDLIKDVDTREGVSKITVD